MKNIFKFMMLAAAAIAFAACNPNQGNEPEPEQPEVELNQNLSFTLEVTTVEAEQAKVKVTNSGTGTDTWYGFVTKEVSKSDAALIEAEVKALLAAGDKISGLKKQTATTVTLRNLDPQTDYKYVVFGLAEDGTVYGTFESVEFKTLKGEVEYTENAAWTVEYKGAGKIGENTYEHTVTVTSTDKNLYFITAVTKEQFETKGIKAIAEEELAYLKNYINSFNQANGTNYKLGDILFEGSGIDALGLEAGDWYALAIGVDAAGDCSGLYAKSAVITIAEEEMTEAYAGWLGNWTLTGANGISQEVTFHKGAANKTYYMTGYEGEDTEGLAVEVLWSEENEVWVINNQTLGTYDFGQYGQGTIWFVGMDAEGSLYLQEELPICMGGMFEDGTLGAVPYTEEWEEEDGSTGSYIVDSMLFLVKLSGGLSYLSGTYEIGFPSFPLTITPSEVATRSAETVKNVQIATNLVKPYRTFGFVK